MAGPAATVRVCQRTDAGAGPSLEHRSNRKFNCQTGSCDHRQHKPPPCHHAHVPHHEEAPATLLLQPRQQHR